MDAVSTQSSQSGSSFGKVVIAVLITAVVVAGATFFVAKKMQPVNQPPANQSMSEQTLKPSSHTPTSIFGSLSQNSTYIVSTVILGGQITKINGSAVTIQHGSDTYTIATQSNTFFVQLNSDGKTPPKTTLFQPNLVKIGDVIEATLSLNKDSQVTVSSIAVVNPDILNRYFNAVAH